MPVIKVWCLPKLAEWELKGLHTAIVSAVVSVSELGLKNEMDMTVLFPTDAMKYGLGSEIIVEVTGLFILCSSKARTEEFRQRLAQAIGTTVKGMFPKAMVECFVYPFDPTQGFWTNPLMGRRHKPTKKELGGLDLASPGWGEKTQWKFPH